MTLGRPRIHTEDYELTTIYIKASVKRNLDILCFKKKLSRGDYIEYLIEVTKWVQGDQKSITKNAKEYL